ncbi:hypothetical protein [Pseudomonas juntendi]|uniref:hypothetical protein n=1 Tax=Pseudomonas TaxID=286 RepID=UPI0035BE3167
MHAARGNNFAKTMLRLAKDLQPLNVTADQIEAQTAADCLPMWPLLHYSSATN